MNTVKQSFMGLLQGINQRVLADGMPTSTLCTVAEQTVEWANENPLNELETKQVRMLSQVMSIAGAGMTGSATDAFSALRRLKATVPMFIKSMNKK